VEGHLPIPLKAVSVCYSNIIPHVYSTDGSVSTRHVLLKIVSFAKPYFSLVCYEVGNGAFVFLCRVLMLKRARRMFLYSNGDSIAEVFFYGKHGHSE